MSQFLDPRRDPGSSQADGTHERPKLADSVAIACELWIVVVIARTVTAIAQYPTLRKAMEQRVADLPADTPRSEVDMLTSTGFLVTATAITAVVLAAITLTFVFFVRKGYNWARILLGAMGVFVLIDMVFSLIAGVDPWWVGIPLIVGGIAALGATILLLRRESDAYCRAMAEYRRPRPAAQPWPPQQYPPQPYPSQPYPSQPHPSQQYPPQSYPSPYDGTQNPYGQPPHGQPSTQQPAEPTAYPQNPASSTSWEEEARRRGWQPPSGGGQTSPHEVANPASMPSGSRDGDYPSGQESRSDGAAPDSHQNEPTPQGVPSTDRKQSSDPS
ncbi:hypothetical protein [Gordonia aichiensis]